MPVEWSLTIIAFSFLVLTLFAVLFLLQARRTAQAVESAILGLEKRLPAILSKAEELLETISASSQSIRAQVESLSITVARIQNLSDYIFSYERAARKLVDFSVMKAVRNVAALRRGLSAFLAALSDPVRIE